MSTITPSLFPTPVLPISAAHVLCTQICRRVFTFVIRMMEYHAYGADDPCLPRRYPRCSKRGHRLQSSIEN